MRGQRRTLWGCYLGVTVMPGRSIASLVDDTRIMNTRIRGYADTRTSGKLRTQDAMRKSPRCVNRTNRYSCVQGHVLKIKIRLHRSEPQCRVKPIQYVIQSQRDPMSALRLLGKRPRDDNVNRSIYKNCIPSIHHNRKTLCIQLSPSTPCITTATTNKISRSTSLHISPLTSAVL